MQNGVPWIAADILLSRVKQILGQKSGGEQKICCFDETYQNERNLRNQSQIWKNASYNGWNDDFNKALV
jgi:hypothetical protein